jgi:hypothetical protein
MESFARAVEIVLKDSELRDDRGYGPDTVLWQHAGTHCGDVQLTARSVGIAPAISHVSDRELQSQRATRRQPVRSGT